MEKKYTTTMSETLECAADLIEEIGWTKEQMRAISAGEIVGYCALGAIDECCGLGRASYPTPAPSDAFLHAQDAAMALARGKGLKPNICGARGMVANWNDTVARSRREVVAALRKAAATAARKEKRKK